MLRWTILLFSIIVCLNVTAATNLTSLSDKGIDSWEPKEFSGESIYTIDEYKGRLALKALSHNAASGLVLEQQIDLTATPYLNWSWLVEKTLLQLDERSKNGDDFVARIYVVIDGGFMVWKTKSLNYVWSSNQDKDLVWDNAFAGSSVKMMSVRGKEAQQGQWYQEKRNVYQDLIDIFGDKGSEQANQKAYQYIDIIAIMTDTDNSGKQAESYYGDIVFSAM
ncbi:hypothetical protein CXF80_06020 [Shewanella sp. Actino-trap-3]|uniref:DUF3047 domain-containing protein n=1 Tax=Shewanella sp. Actino-trap-3 TaxID=2058331 RepID=UPI000C32F905|nr:DUF3047 domain-containing protein [Shewanella sp. Actino-trap-3]PKG77906.1 hypothetical protein CXF80_06020 [Shewanella sp. Actino-trap-3]